MKKLSILSIGFLIFTLSCAGSPTPTGQKNDLTKEEAAELFTNPASVYPEDQYLVAVGTGDTRRDAENDAMAALARIFRSDIKMSSQGQKQYRELITDNSSLTELEKNLIQTVDVQANQELLGIKFSPSYTDDRGMVSIVAYLDRNEVGRLYRNLIQKNNERIASLVNISKSAESIAKEFGYINGALIVAEGNQIYLDQLQVIKPAMAALAQPELDKNTLLSMRDEVQNRMTFEISLEGDDDGRFTDVLKQELGKSGFAYEEPGTLSITGKAQITPTGKSGDYFTAQWILSLSLVDNLGKTLASYEKIDRENGISEDQVELLASKSVEKQIIRKFAPMILDYFHTLVTEE